MSEKIEEEQRQQPTRLKNTDFDMVHKQITLEQELNKLKPFIAYKRLSIEKEDSKIAKLKDPTDDNIDWDNILEELIEKNEYGRTDKPKKATPEDWLDYYNFMYKSISKQKQTTGGIDRGFDWLYAEWKEAKNKLSHDNDQTFHRHDAVKTVIQKKQKEFPEQHLSYQERRGIKIDDKKCDNNDIAFNNQKRLYYLKLNNKITNGKNYKDLTRREKREMIEQLKREIVKINQNEGQQYKKMLTDGTQDQIKQTKKALEDKLKEMGFSFKVVSQEIDKKDQKLNHTIGNNKNLNFFHTFGENPSIDNFIKADNHIRDKCPNILNDDMQPFLSEDPSEMGGHPGAFINIYVPKDGDKECTVYGGKKWDGDSRVEYNFYQYIYKNKEDPLLLSFKKYIPEYIKDNKCKPFTDQTTEYELKKMDYYFPIANIKNIVRKENEKIQTADFKIGYRTSFLHEKGNKGNKGGVTRDKFHSTSDKLGFRLEGSSLIKKINKISRKHPKLSGWHTTPSEGRMKKFGKSIKPISAETDILPGFAQKKLKVPQFNLYVLTPGFIFDTIFHNQTDKNIKDFQEKLKIFEKDFIKKNFEAFNSGKKEKKAIAFIGCSFFFVSGENGIDFKLIDFAHPYLLSWEEKDGKRVLSETDDLCCPTYLKDGKPIPGLTNKNNKMAVKYNYKKKVEKKKIDAVSTGVEGVKSATNVIANVAQSGGGWPWSGERESIYSIDKDENKRDLTYKEWEHTFFNFMSGLLSMIYSFHIWANSRLHYKLSDDNARKRNIRILRESYFSDLYKRPVQKITKDKTETWMDLPDNIDLGNAEYDERIKRTIEETWDEPYRWDESIKITQFNALLVNSKSNLLNANV